MITGRFETSLSHLLQLHFQDVIQHIKGLIIRSLNEEMLLKLNYIRKFSETEKDIAVLKSFVE